MATKAALRAAHTIARELYQSAGGNYLTDAEIIDRETGLPELIECLQHAVHWFDQLTPKDAARYQAAIWKAVDGKRLEPVACHPDLIEGAP